MHSSNTTLLFSSTSTNDIRTSDIYTTNTPHLDPRCLIDESPNPDNTCLEFYRWHLCEEDWMTGWCCGTCGYSSCLDLCYENDTNNIPSIYYHIAIENIRFAFLKYTKSSFLYMLLYGLRLFTNLKRIQNLYLGIFANSESIQ